MKNAIIAVISFLLISGVIIIGKTSYKNEDNLKTKTKLNIGNASSIESKKVSDYFGTDTVHSKFGNQYKLLNCKTCHVGEYPTKTDPQLISCPREGMISVYHRPDEGPEVVLLNEISDRYVPVVFSHKLHAQMSEMGESCNGCHHYNTTGPVLPCRKCHSFERKRDDVSIPDLRAAYHRQCMQCHRQWNYTTGCNNTCHALKKDKSQAYVDAEIAKFKGKEHPPLETPVKLTFETNYEKGKIVTFYHEEHVKMFNLPCVACHQNNNCVKCHDKKHLFKNNDPEFVKPIKVHKTLEEHHKPCFGCHADENKSANCKKCHKDSEMKPFNHAATTGWALNRYHVSLACKDCHGNSTPYTRLNNNCTTCHKNFKAGSFNHLVTGFVLGENHQDMDCDNCHLKNDFTKKPDCSSCHDVRPNYKLTFKKK